jgi:nucleoside 2-deoxyribosyltransferase
MKIFCSYPFTGSDLDYITARLKLVIDTLNSVGHEAYCNRFDQNVLKMNDEGNIKGVFRSAFNHIKSRDALVVIIESPKVSLGTLMEVGVALDHEMPVYLFAKKGINWLSYLPQLATNTFEWETEQDLANRLKKVEKLD